MEDLPTFYDVLEIAETASPAEASAAYRRMVKEYHPDRLVGLPDHLTKLREDAQEKWQEIQAAWDVLGDPVKRAQYDEGLKELRGQTATASAPPPASHSSNTAPPPPYSSTSGSAQATSSRSTSHSGSGSHLHHALLRRVCTRPTTPLGTVRNAGRPTGTAVMSPTTKLLISAAS
jgi:DnaJ-class molecular chaperone